MSLRPDPSDPGVNYTFSGPLQRGLRLAVDAARIEDGEVEPRHLLLSLLQMGDATAFSVLEGLRVDPDEITDRLEESSGSDNLEDAVGDRVSYTEEAKKALEFALAEARVLDSLYVGTEHLLLALLRQEGSLARQALNAAGVNLEEARAETQRVWESGEDERGTGDNFADEAMTRALRDSLEGGEETVAQFIRRLGAAETADWARFPDGNWKTWEDVDWDADGEEIWNVVLEWQQRRDRAGMLLEEAGLVDPRFQELEAQLREMEEEGQADTLEYAKIKLARDLLRLSQDRRGDDDGAGTDAG